LKSGAANAQDVVKMARQNLRGGEIFKKIALCSHGFDEKWLIIG
jgi:hypothetical protein